MGGKQELGNLKQFTEVKVRGKNLQNVQIGLQCPRPKLVFNIKKNKQNKTKNKKKRGCKQGRK
jgi:hypothetical protein